MDMLPDALTARAELRLREEGERSAQARVLATQFAAIAASEFGATEVFLVGSVLVDRARPGSDIDLVVRGVDPRRFADMKTRFWAVSDTYYVDVIDLDTADGPWNERLRTAGLRLFP